VAAEPLVVFAGRLIPDKDVTAGVAAVAAAAAHIPGLRAVFYGDGPERGALDEAIAEHGLQEVVSAPGFADGEQVAADLRRALCMLLPSRREGYGMIVIEAAAVGTPSVVVAGEDNAATELVEDRVNGIVAASSDPEVIAAAITEVQRGGEPMRERTARWFAENAAELSLESSLAVVLGVYREGSSAVPSRRSRSRARA
jgi:glycosyltransferase involved in cell wall biosynthesis